MKIFKCEYHPNAIIICEKNEKQYYYLRLIFAKDNTSQIIAYAHFHTYLYNKNHIYVNMYIYNVDITLVFGLWV